MVKSSDGYLIGHPPGLTVQEKSLSGRDAAQSENTQELQPDSCPPSYALELAIDNSLGTLTPFLAARISAMTLTAISAGVLLPI